MKTIDARVLPADVLVETVEIALKARDIFPWARAYSKNDFMSFVASYKGSTEEIEKWRGTFWTDKDLQQIARNWRETFERAETAGRKSEAFRRMVHEINAVWLAKRAQYAPRGAPDLTPLTTLKQKKGRCTDLSNLCVAVLRTVGVGATGVRTIWWPKENSNHYWVCVLDPISNEWLNFDAADDSEYSESYFLKFVRSEKRPHAKVYRTTPGQECGGIPVLLSGAEGKLPPFVDHYLFSVPVTDVTKEYTQVARAEVRGLPPSTLVFLSVYNNNGWSEVCAARSGRDGTAFFDDMGCLDVLYMPTFVKKTDSGSAQAAAGPPLILRRNGAIDAVSGSPGGNYDGDLGSAKCEFKRLGQGVSVKLGAWSSKDLDWTEISDAVTAADGSVSFDGLRPGVVYVIYVEARASDGMHKVVQGRPFLMEPEGGTLVRKEY
jgi:transglutaminase-like putative cysteine protease